MTLAPPNVSFEFFPARNQAGEHQLWQTIWALSPLAPDFLSVTYGAGGSDRDGTDATLRRITEETPMAAAGHLTCVGQSRDAVDGIARDWWQAGIRRIVALRGDAREEGKAYAPHPQGYENAADLVAGLRGIADFDISVAAYPESHPDSSSEAADLDNLKRKLDAGASRALTQYFFDAETFLRFRDRATAAGITQTLVPGILPVANFKGLVKFSAKCGAHIPAWLAERFDGLTPGSDLHIATATATATNLCQTLRREGVEDFHFYTLNQSTLTHATCRSLGIHPSTRRAA